MWIPSSPGRWPTHLVIKGQTLKSIAEAYGISELQLSQANTLSGAENLLGKSLLLPRRTKPEWAAFEEEKKPSNTSSRERHRIRSSRGIRKEQRPKALAPLKVPSGPWTKITLADGRQGWVRTEDLQFTPPKTKPVTAVKPKPPSSQPLTFGKRLGESRKQSVLQMVADLKKKGYTIKADDIITFMALETGGTFDPAIQGGGGVAVGLAQFTSIAIRDMNQRRAPNNQLSRSRLARMSFDEQSRVVTEYLSTAFSRKRMEGRVVTRSDLYCAIFAPRAIGTSLHSTVYSSGRDPNAYYGNRSLDANGDGRITKAELVIRLDEWVRRGEKLRG